MLKTLFKTSAAMAVALIAIAPASADVLLVNTGWQDDILEAAGVPTNRSAWTFTVDTSATLSVVDCCIPGDGYTLSGDVFGTTTFYAGGAGDIQATGDYGSYWTDATYSKIALLVGPGTYTFSITGDLGSGFPGAASLGVRLDSVGGAVPEPMTWALMAVGLGAVGASMRRRKVTTSVSFV